MLIIAGFGRRRNKEIRKREKVTQMFVFLQSMSTQISPVTFNSSCLSDGRLGALGWLTFTVKMVKMVPFVSEIQVMWDISGDI